MKTLFHFLVFITICNAYSQNTNIFRNSNEKFNIQTNDNIYITGETLFYNIKVNNTTDTLSSKIIYVELINQKKQSVKQKKEVKNNQTNGDVFLKTNLETGIYKLVAYSKKSLLQQNTNFCEKEILIINPYQSNENYLSDLNDSLTLTNNIQLVNKTYKPREKVNIKIPNYNAKNISISVKKNDLNFVFRNNECENKSLKNKHSTINYENLPEIRGEIISGKVLNYKPKDKITNYINLTTLNKEVTTKITKIEKDGSFKFLLEKPIYDNEILIQLLNEEKTFIVKIDSISFDYSTLNWNNNIKIPRNKLAKINERAVANQIEIAYYNSKKDTIKENTKKSFFYYPNYKEILLDDYTRFNTLNEVIVEILDGVITKKIDNTNYIYIFNPITNPLNNLPALVLLNGVIVQDYDVLFKLNAKKISSVQIMNDKFYLGEKSFDGVINFISDNTILDINFSPYQVINITPILQEKQYFVENYSKNKKEHIPDLRYNLYWNPNVSQNSTVTFYTSDVEGTYIVSINIEEQNGTIKTFNQTFTISK